MHTIFCLKVGYFDFVKNILKVVRYSKGQKISNFTFDARSQQWLVQLPQKLILWLRLLHTAENHGPTMFHMATVRHKRWHLCLLYRTSLRQPFQQKNLCWYDYIFGGVQGDAMQGALYDRNTGNVGKIKGTTRPNQW